MVTDVTEWITEQTVFSGIISTRRFLPIEALFVVEESLCDVRTPSSVLISLIQFI